MKPHDISPDDEIPLEKYFPDVPRGTLDSIQTYAKRVWEWNHHINLTGAKSFREFVLAQIIDCVASRGILSLAEHWIDVGTGAGLPGIVWSLLEPEKAFLLVESLNKRVGFLHRVLSLHPNPRVKVAAQRFEDLHLPEIFEGETELAIVSRGTASPPDLLELAKKSKLPWKLWAVFSTKKTHSDFLTLSEKFGMKAESYFYQIPSPVGPGKEGILTILRRNPD